MATFLKISNAAIVFPIILKKLPAEMVGIWTIFATIYSFVVLMDFGFSPSFTRNVTYIFSGVQSLKTTGYETIIDRHPNINYSLLKGIIDSMKFFYRRIALLSLVILVSFGTFYISILLKTYSGSHFEIYLSWILLCLITSYNLYTLYYNSLIQGKGLVKKDKQINVVGQLLNIIISIFLLISGYKIISIVIGQVVSVVVVRYLSYRAFYTEEINEELRCVQGNSSKEVLKIIYPNAIKVGLTSLGGILITKSSLFIGSLYLPLAKLASYGITMQLISVIAGLSVIYFETHQPRVVSLRVSNKKSEILVIYKNSLVFFLFTYFICGCGLFIVGPYLLDVIGSNTTLMNESLVLVALLGSMLEINVGLAGAVLLTKNQVPFFMASLISGLSTLILLILFATFFQFSMFVMVLIPIIVNIAYQGWKWPLVAYLELRKT